MKRTLLAAAILVSSLAGCAATAESAPTSVPVEPAPPATFDTVDDLRSAYVDAGGECSEWRQTDVITLAAQSGQCDADTVLSIYLSESNRDEVIAGMKSILAVHLIVGENWILNTDAEDDSFATELGGTVVTSPGP
jgi:hypothetical protein